MAHTLMKALTLGDDSHRGNIDAAAIVNLLRAAVLLFNTNKSKSDRSKDKIVIPGGSRSRGIYFRIILTDTSRSRFNIYATPTQAILCVLLLNPE